MFDENDPPFKLEALVDNLQGIVLFFDFAIVEEDLSDIEIVRERIGDCLGAFQKAWEFLDKRPRGGNRKKDCETILQTLQIFQKALEYPLLFLPILNRGIRGNPVNVNVFNDIQGCSLNFETEELLNDLLKAWQYSFDCYCHEIHDHFKERGLLKKCTKEYQGLLTCLGKINLEGSQKQKQLIDVLKVLRSHKNTIDNVRAVREGHAIMRLERELLQFVSIMNTLNNEISVVSTYLQESKNNRNV